MRVPPSEYREVRLSINVVGDDADEGFNSMLDWLVFVEHFHRPSHGRCKLVDVVGVVVAGVEAVEHRMLGEQL
jgi:hypothetical protein